MSVIEIITFRLTGDVDEAAFLDADRRVQTDFAYQQPGLVRRTTARNDEGEWAVVHTWATAAAAEAAGARRPADPAIAAFLALVDRATLQSRRYATLD